MLRGLLAWPAAVSRQQRQSGHFWANERLLGAWGVLWLSLGRAQSGRYTGGTWPAIFRIVRRQERLGLEEQRGANVCVWGRLLVLCHPLFIVHHPLDCGGGEDTFPEVHTYHVAVFSLATLCTLYIMGLASECKRPLQRSPMYCNSALPIKAFGEAGLDFLSPTLLVPPTLSHILSGTQLP